MNSEHRDFAILTKFGRCVGSKLDFFIDLGSCLEKPWIIEDVLRAIRF